MLFSLRCSTPLNGVVEIEGGQLGSVMICHTPCGCLAQQGTYTLKSKMRDSETAIVLQFYSGKLIFRLHVSGATLKKLIMYVLQFTIACRKIEKVCFITVVVEVDFSIVLPVATFYGSFANASCHPPGSSKPGKIQRQKGGGSVVLSCQTVRPREIWIDETQLSTDIQ